MLQGSNGIREQSDNNKRIYCDVKCDAGGKITLNVIHNPELLALWKKMATADQQHGDELEYLCRTRQTT